MKKVKEFFWLIVCALLALCFISCEWADSKPLNPKIIGTAHIQSEKGLVFVEIDSLRYAVDRVFTGKHDSRSGEDITIEAVDGMLVTAFMSDNSAEVLFITGRKDAVEIAAMFHRSNVVLFACLVIMLIGTIALAISASGRRKNKEEIPVAGAD